MSSKHKRILHLYKTKDEANLAKVAHMKEPGIKHIFDSVTNIEDAYRHAGNEFNNIYYYEYMMDDITNEAFRYMETRIQPDAVWYYR